MTSSANSVVFLTTFQLGMSPIVRLRLTRLLPASSSQLPEGVGDLLRRAGDDAVDRDQVVPVRLPWTSAAWMRLRNSGTVT